jgi:archaellum component FlaF (FlaF/FlaG flagellin family)
VVGSLIIILIVTIAGVGVYAYSVNALSESSDNFSQKTTYYSEQVQERFEILRVWSDNQDAINVTIYNYGQTDLSINALYLNGTAVQHYQNGKDTTIGTGQLLNVEFTSPLSLQNGNSLEILAVSARGGKTTVLYEA